LAASGKKKQALAIRRRGADDWHIPAPGAIVDQEETQP
jgi:hypothetical protein